MTQTDKEIDALAEEFRRNSQFMGNREFRAADMLLALKARAEAAEKEQATLQGDIEDLRALVSEYRDIRLSEWKARAEKAEAALSTARAEALDEAVQAARQVGYFVGIERHELTDDYGQPRFDMMNDIIQAIEALKE
jgi:predicted  nucleic acid-binding Zn-ribbon protein